ncbi:nitrilase-related carbon-nitrogen hydrolase, partial [Chloroflexota bacterium]
MHRLRIGMAQINTTVGDFKSNTGKMLEAVDKAKSLGIDLLTFPELATCGYPPEDLLFKSQFIDENLKSLDLIIKHSSGITLVAGFVDAKKDLYNAAAVIHDGKLVDIYHKIHLPNYGVFDENRYFKAGKKIPIHIIGGVGIGINICEDIWCESGPAKVQAYSGAEVIINISASPYHAGRGNDREKMLSARASNNVAIVAYNNLIGGQDELVFDGNSLILDEKGRLIARGKQFEEDFIVADLDVESVSQTRLRDSKWQKETQILEKKRHQAIKKVVSQVLTDTPKPPLPPSHVPVRDLPGEVYDALVLGTHDYVLKNGFKKVLIGLSGGIDSSLVAAIAVDALGKANVAGAAMPSKYSSPGSIADAKLLARNLGIEFMTIPINGVFQAYLEMLSGAFRGV